MKNIPNGLLQFRYAILGKEKQEKIIDTTARAIPELYWFRLDLTLGSVLMVANCPVS